MAERAGFIKTTLVGGALFLLPLILVAFLIHKAVGFLQKFVGPLSREMHFLDFLPGHILAYALSLLLLVLIAFAAGLVARTRIGTSITSRLEGLILHRIPGYKMLRSMGHGSLGVPDEGDVKTVLARVDETWLIGFLIEESRSGLLTVFVPSAPTPTGGSLYFLTEEQVRRVDVPVHEAIRCLMKLGVGSAKLLERAMPAPNGGSRP
jgi:uncharacterized membrane protein